MTGDSLGEMIQRMFAEAHLDLDRRMPTSGEPSPTVTVHKSTAYVPVSLEVLVDSGAITEDEARARGWRPPPRPSWRSRLHWRFRVWRDRAGRKVGGWIAGVDLSERVEDW